MSQADPPARYVHVIAKRRSTKSTPQTHILLRQRVLFQFFVLCVLTALRMSSMYICPNTWGPFPHKCSLHPFRSRCNIHPVFWAFFNEIKGMKLRQIVLALSQKTRRTVKSRLNMVLCFCYPCPWCLRANFTKVYPTAFAKGRMETIYL